MNYHITQEQATDLFKPFVLPIKEVVAQSKDDFYFVTDEQLKSYANAVLDKVLGEPVAWNPMETAPTDGTIVRLLVEFTDNSLEDSPEPVATIGHNSFDDTLIDEWQFAGWNWSHDCYIQGAGKPIGWLPLLYAPKELP